MRPAAPHPALQLPCQCRNFARAQGEARPAPPTRRAWLLLRQQLGAARCCAINSAAQLLHFHPRRAPPVAYANLCWKDNTARRPLFAIKQRGRGLPGAVPARIFLEDSTTYLLSDAGFGAFRRAGAIVAIRGNEERQSIDHVMNEGVTQNA
jgi:hypothetical protein